ncbi:hypothetical protein [Sphaerochaeta halotolerans]|uniref:hypothetical protein n=1 Tax=Sphaerochaeta halotolerans TaxID=2293840 RepID=UPI0019D20EEF|nr:hypothetical protein [Sphaerochaeta halotolerans]
MERHDQDDDCRRQSASGFTCFGHKCRNGIQDEAQAPVFLGGGRNHGNAHGAGGTGREILSQKP